MPTFQQILAHGWQVHQSGKIDDAQRIYRSVLDDRPGDPDALVYLGIALFDQLRFDESVAVYQQALAGRSVFPIGWNNLGNSLRMLGRVDEAEAAFVTALDQDPQYLSAFKNRGTLWVWTGEIDKGLQCYEAGLQIDPNSAELHRNLGVIYLLQGDYDRGWPQYRWRWAMPSMPRPQCHAPLWQGEPIDGKSILLYPEQGRGDAIQFIRMAKVLSDAGARVIVQCAPEMIALFTSAAGISMLVPHDVVAPPVDYHASLIDTVDVWYTQTGQMPYGVTGKDRSYLTVSTPLIDYWKNWLDQNVPVTGSQRRIGINWQGNREHHADVYRSLPLSELKPLTKIPDVQLVNLQFGDGVEQIDQVDFGDQIHCLPNDVDATDGAFTDTAAILQNLDAVVTSDTALAHLSGAVGTDVHLLLGRVPDWRWLTQGDRSDWYPTMQIARQIEVGNWSDPVHQCCDRLSH
ncbi:tetratricopeptide repeat protein [Planctomycetes bacterium K23_9]|uniref:Tetratricopeptide repeat protein n=1 Tax=Stieleria marina TaxID=1930275 RepID=A0A517NMM9_9BACT|nr:Tetratricopeptide repeat protein [Planctomycetes bacterium K23_9]